MTADTQVVRRGISGARVFVYDHEAIKVGYGNAHRVVEQGKWLVDNPGPNLPVVVTILAKGYSMHPLDELPVPDVRLDRMTEALSQSVWAFAPKAFVNTPRTMLKVARILENFAPSLLTRVIDRIAYVHRTQDCLTHGDPTAENVMISNDGSYVIIDPIPATEAVPDDLAVDVGKLLQSAHGWEEMKGLPRASFTPDDVARCFESSVLDVAHLWCIVHFIRTLPYAKKEVRERVVDKLEDLLGL